MHHKKLPENFNEMSKRNLSAKISRFEEIKKQTKGRIDENEPVGTIEDANKNSTKQLFYKVVLFGLSFAIEEQSCERLVKLCW